jgi:hypothetical protein
MSIIAKNRGYCRDCKFFSYDNIQVSHDVFKTGSCSLQNDHNRRLPGNICNVLEEELFPNKNTTVNVFAYKTKED